jgi:hypothetical protein
VPSKIDSRSKHVNKWNQRPARPSVLIRTLRSSAAFLEA